MSGSPPPLAHPDSINSQDPNSHPDEKKPKSRRPANTAFRQQRLKAWQPILTPKTVLPLFFLIGIIFAPIGGGLLYASAVVQEIRIDYSNCLTDAPDFPATTQVPVSSSIFKSNSSTSISDTKPTWSRVNVTKQLGRGMPEIPVTQCQLNFTIPNNMDPPVYFYYQLTNFYQNHRRYAKSFDTDQLSGKAVSADNVKKSDCTPLTTTVIDGRTLPYYPCGLAANSVFNDTFSQPVLLDALNSNANATTYNMTNAGIAWASDKGLYGPTKYNTTDIAVPPNWVLRYGNGTYSVDNPPPDLSSDEEFQVWMRLAGLPVFSKLAQKNENEIMSHGQYSVTIDLHFPVTEYGGTKAIVISTGTVMGGRNPFLGIAYVVVGGVCVVLGVLFTVTHLIRPRKLGDHTYLSWNNDNTQSSATTSGRDGVLASEHA